jgi:hypothetical protein
MARHRPGQWGRRRARERRRQLLREHWLRLGAFFGGIAVVCTAAAIGAALLFNTGLAWFIFGVGYGGGLTLWMTTFDLIDPVGRRLTQGVEGETSTARQLRRCARHGWRAVHNLVLQAGDIDHIAIGPGGVVVIETKQPDADWAWLHKNGVDRRWATQARTASARVRALVRQHTGLTIEPVPILVVWARGLADSGPVEVDGVRVVHGRTLPNLLDDLDGCLQHEQVEMIHAALEPVARKLDQHWESRRVAVARN